MSLSKAHFEISTWMVYPRIHYFWQRFNGLITRFKKFAVSFPPSFRDEDLLLQIDNVQSEFNHSLGVTVISYDSLELGEIVVSLKPWTEQNVVELQSPPVIHVYICYIKVDKTDDVGWQKISSTIEFFYNEYGKADSNVFESLFIDIDILLPSSMVDEELWVERQISERMLSLYSGWSYNERVLFRSKGDNLCNSLTRYLEYRIVTGFHKVYSYLDMFIRTDKHITITDNDYLNNCLTLKLCQYLRNPWSVVDIQEPATSSGEPTALPGTKVSEVSEVSLDLDQVISGLTNVVKCMLVTSLSDKFNLVAWQVNLFLHELQIESDIVKCVSTSTQESLRNYYSELIRNQKTVGHDADLLHEFYKQIRVQCKDVVSSLLYDMRPCIDGVELKVRNMSSLVSLMEKMMFEIEGYLSVTITEVYSPKSVAPNVPDRLREELLTIENVYAVGTVYNKLEVHVHNNTPELRKKIDEVVEKHSYSWQYIVKPVEQKIHTMGQIMYENGAMIKCPKATQNETSDRIVTVRDDDTVQYHTGTLGGFVVGNDNKLYGLTAAHVVSNFLQNLCEVYICDSSILYKFGQSQHHLVVNTGQSELPLVDIGTFIIHDHMAPLCLRLPKDDNGCNRQGCIASDKVTSLLKRFVYKHGAGSEFTSGIICSTDIAVVGNNDYLIMVESLPMDSEPFAVPGDSGSIICCPDIDTDKIKLIAMLTGGDYKIEGDSKPKYMCFHLKQGLKQLSVKSGISFSVD